MRSLLLLIAVTVSPASASESALPDDFNALFAVTCMQHFHSQEKLRDQLDKRGLERLPPDQAGFFLGGTEGTAWLILAPSTRYVVSLRKDSICSVFAHRADPKSIQSGFVGLVGTAPTPLAVTNLDDAKLGPNNDHATTIARSWARPGDKEELMFMLTTSSSGKATAQAMASMAVVKRSD